MTSTKWHAGYAECDITPPHGLPMSGYARPDSIAKGTIAPLSAQALALRDANDRTALVISADLMALDRTSVDYLRHALASRCNLAPEAILLAVSHTHWGPATHYRLNFLGNGPAAWFLHSLEAKLIDLAAEAMSKQAPAIVEYSAFEARIGHNRRLPQADGDAGFGVNLEGFYDTHTPVLQVKRDIKANGAGPRQILLLSHACHPTSTGRTARWSPDYPGALRDRVREQLGDDTRTMFAMGCGGDAKVTHTDRRTGETIFAASPARASAAGRKLADAVLAHLATGAAQSLDATLVWHRTTGNFSFAKLRSEDEVRRLFYNEAAEVLDREWARQMLAYPDPRRNYPYEVTVWKLGSALTLWSLPDEICSPLGPRTRAIANTPHAMIAAYTNGVQAYIPSSAIVREGGYEGESSHRAWFLPAPFTERIDREWDKLMRQAVDGMESRSGVIKENTMSNENTFLAGYAEADFTPEPGLTLLGQMHRRVATGARDPLMANASAFRSGDTTVVLVSVDICMLPAPFIDSVQQLFAERTGLPAGCLLMHATHTHVAPTVFPLLAAEVDPKFEETLRSAVLETAVTAVERLEPAELFAGTGHMEHMGWNRRAMLENGTSQMYASSATPGFIGMEGPRDPALPVLFTRNRQGEIKGVVVNFSTHPNSIEGESVYSADVPGASRKTLKQLLGQDVVVVYLTGASANTAPSILDPVNVDQPWRGHAGVDRSGLYLGSEAAKVIAAAIEPVPDPVVRLEQTVINAPIREWPTPESPQATRWRDEHGQAYYDYCAEIWPKRLQEENPVEVRVNVVRIGDVAICTNPAELFVEFGLEMRQASPARVTMVSELMDGYVGYIPTAKAFERGGYETWTAITSQLVPGTGEKIVEKTQEMMATAWGNR